MEVSRSTRIRLPAGLMDTRQRQWDSDDELEDPDDPPAYIEDFCRSPTRDLSSLGGDR